MTFNLTMVYTISLYSEPLFTFLYLVGSYFSDFPLFCSAFLAAATFTRSTGSLLILIPGLTILQRFKSNMFGGCTGFLRAITNVMSGIIIILGVAIVPIVTVTIWKPYENYCLSRLDTDLDVPSWCYQEFPNVYKYIQAKFWKVGFGMFLERPWYLTAVSLFTNQLFLLILYRCLSKNFFTLGLLSK